MLSAALERVAVGSERIQAYGELDHSSQGSMVDLTMELAERRAESSRPESGPDAEGRAGSRELCTSKGRGSVAESSIFLRRGTPGYCVHQTSWVKVGRLVAGRCSGQTIVVVPAAFELHSDGRSVKFTVPSMTEIRCFLNRQSVAVAASDKSSGADREGDGAYDEYNEYDECEEHEELGEYVDEDLEYENVEVAELSDGDAWVIAGLFGIGQHSPSWWLNAQGGHGSQCACRPAGLLEVLQDYATSSDRQGALEAHLGALRDVWDHFWSGDSLVNGEGEHINGACPACITEGRDHLGDILDEARNLAEELGEALAAFHSHIDLGLDRY